MLPFISLINIDLLVLRPYAHYIFVDHIWPMLGKTLLAYLDVLDTNASGVLYQKAGLDDILRPYAHYIFVDHIWPMLEKTLLSAYLNVLLCSSSVYQC